MSTTAIPAYIKSLIRHSEDLRDGTHGGYQSVGTVRTVLICERKVPKSGDHRQ
jgi:hypothetical protein